MAFKGGYKSSDGTAGITITTGGAVFKDGLLTGGEIATGEPALGNPAADGMVLSSTAAGVRSWVEQSAGDSVMPMYRRHYKTANETTPDGFASGAFGLGRVFTANGEYIWHRRFSSDNVYPMAQLLSINVSVAASGDVSIPILEHDVPVYVYVDGVLETSITSNYGRTPITLTWGADAGAHLVQFVFNSTVDQQNALIIGEWIDGTNVQYIGTPD